MEEKEEGLVEDAPMAPSVALDSDESEEDLEESSEASEGDDDELSIEESRFVDGSARESTHTKSKTSS